MPIPFKGIKIPKLNLFRLKKFKRREKALLALFALCLSWFLFYKNAYRPKSLMISGLAAKYNKVNTQKLSLEAQMPDVEAEKKKLEEMKKKYEEFKEKLKVLETHLWDRSRMPELLKTVTEPKSGGELELLWIKTKKQTIAQDASVKFAEKDQRAAEQAKKAVEPYPKLFIEMSFYSSFEALINYVKELEDMEGYLKVADIKISLSEAKPTTPRAILTLSTLLGEGIYTPEEDKDTQKIFAAAEEMIEKDIVEPFNPGSKPFKTAPSAGLRLSGIMGVGDSAVAVINDSFYKVGEKVADKTVVSIEEKEVVLQKEDQRFYLELE